MKIFLVAFAYAIVASEARLFSSLSESLLGQKERGGVHGSGRILRKREHSEESSSSGTAFGNIWYSAISTSDSTATVDGKCRLPDGTVVGIGYHQKGKGKGKGKSKSSKGKGSSSSKDECGKGKGKSSMSKGKGYGNSCAPSLMPSISPSSSPTETLAPTKMPSEAPSPIPTVSESPSETASQSPTDCYGKGSKCSKNVKKKGMDSSRPKGKTAKSSKSKKSKSSSKGSKGKGKGRYEDLEIPYCPTDPPTSSPVAGPGGTDIEENAFCSSIMDRTVQPEGPVVQEAKLYAIVVEKEPVADLADLLDKAILTILASLSGCDVELNLGQGRRVLAVSDDDTPIATSDKVTKMEVTGKIE